jgi:uncharacterized protein (DUF885 family)
MKTVLIRQIKTITVARVLSLLLVSHATWGIDNPGLARLVADYGNQYPGLDIAPLAISYVENLQNIRSDESRKRQLEYFESLATQLRDIDSSELGAEDQYTFQHFEYIAEINLQRILLENRYVQARGQDVISNQGIFHESMGKDWYRYFLRKWLSVDTTPEALVEFGNKEITKVQKQISEIQVQTGYADDEPGFYLHLKNANFFLYDEDEITAAYRERENRVTTNLGKLFLEDDAPPINIRPYLVSDKDTPPGSVVLAPEEITFQYNFFQEEHNTRAMDFIFLHEAVPGHAYQYQYFRSSNFDKNIPITASALVEGWAAYCEELGLELGLYQSPYDFLGKLEFDLVRSVRVVMDVGLNYYGWTNQQALDFWHANIKGQDEIAQREIDRMLRWPVQVLTYKVGADKIMALKTLAQQKLGEQFDSKEFHHRIIGFGYVPLFLVERRVNEYIERRLQDQ